MQILAFAFQEIFENFWAFQSHFLPRNLYCDDQTGFVEIRKNASRMPQKWVKMPLKFREMEMPVFARTLINKCVMNLPIKMEC